MNIGNDNLSAVNAPKSVSPIRTLDERAGLDGKVAVVTGGAGGLGVGAVLALAHAGVSVAFCDVDAAAVKSTLEGLKQQGCQALGVVSDVRDETAVTAYF